MSSWLVAWLVERFSALTSPWSAYPHNLTREEARAEEKEIRALLSKASPGSARHANLTDELKRIHHLLTSLKPPSDQIEVYLSRIESLLKEIRTLDEEVETRCQHRARLEAERDEVKSKLATAQELRRQELASKTDPRGKVKRFVEQLEMLSNDIASLDTQERFQMLASLQTTIATKVEEAQADLYTLGEDQQPPQGDSWLSPFDSHDPLHMFSQNANSLTETTRDFGKASQTSSPFRPEMGPTPFTLSQEAPIFQPHPGATASSSFQPQATSPFAAAVPNRPQVAETGSIAKPADAPVTPPLLPVPKANRAPGQGETSYDELARQLATATTRQKTAEAHASKRISQLAEEHSRRQQDQNRLHLEAMEKESAQIRARETQLQQQAREHQQQLANLNKEKDERLARSLADERMRMEAYYKEKEASWRQQHQGQQQQHLLQQQLQQREHLAREETIQKGNEDHLRSAMELGKQQANVTGESR